MKLYETEVSERWGATAACHCTDDILATLGIMYVSDRRFRKNIDKHGSGTAEYAAAAIDAYSKGRTRI